jgi:small subunit ribosomal protein S1
VKDLQSYLGDKIESRVIEMDRHRNNVVLSRRVILEEGRKADRSEILSKLQEGMILPGTVSSIVDFGAFVDLGGIDGLVHISELSWGHITHPNEVVKVGDSVEVKVLEVNAKRERISLGLKQTQEDPWKALVSRFPIDSIIEGKVTKLVPFGIFVDLGNTVEGLVHISEMARGHVDTPDQVVAVGDMIQVKVMNIDEERRRVSLSMRSAADDLGIEIEIKKKEKPIVPPAVEEEAGAEKSDDGAEETAPEEKAPTIDELPAEEAPAAAAEEAPVAEETAVAEESATPDDEAGEEVPAEKPEEPVVAEEAAAEKEPVAAEESPSLATEEASAE